MFRVSETILEELCISIHIYSQDLMEDLKKFLVELPAASGYRDDKFLRRAVFKALYYSATAEGLYLTLLFSDLNAQTLSDPWLRHQIKQESFYKAIIAEEYTHPPNQICGRVLRSKEKVYRCIDCGYDDTCVICSFCFKREDHEGHNVSVYLSQSNGGMCDCGDETAFVRRLECACLPSQVEDCPENLKTALRSTIKTVLDYALEVANYSINTLPFIHKNINGQGDLRLTSQEISNASSLPEHVYGVNDINTIDKWFLILWNDEDHDYPEAETGIKAATGMDDQKAKQVANEINRSGRAILKEAKRYTDLLSSQKLAQADGLVASISTARDFLRESILLLIFDWLKEIICFEGNSNFRESAKQALGQILLEPGFELSNPTTSDFFVTDTLDVKTACLVNGIALDGYFFPPECASIEPSARLHNLGDSVKRLVMRRASSRLVQSRILYFLAFEVRFVSAVRKKFTRSILPVLFIDSQTRALFCDQYIDAYPMLTSILAFSDREEELASASDISVQLFTCPKTNREIFETRKFAKLLYPLCLLIEDESSQLNKDRIPNLSDIVFDIRSKRLKSAIHNTIKTCMENVTRVVTKNDEENLLNYLLDPNLLPLFLAFLRFFQGLSQVARKYGDHVERESITSFYSFVSKADPVSSIILHSTRVSTLHLDNAKDAVESIFELLQSRVTPTNYHSFRVSKDFVSPFNPINSFFSLILQALDIETVQEFLCDPKIKFQFVSDYSLRSIVLMSQVKVGLWIRNGMTMMRQLCYLLDALSDVNFLRDIHLNQITSIVDPPEETILSFINRWEFSDWFFGRVKWNETIYENKFSFMCERFVLFLYKLLVDRLLFDKHAANAPNALLMKSICYALCEKPKSYSALKKKLPSHIYKSENFDHVLRKCAVFTPPVGIYDTGIYRLKDDQFEHLDPMGQVDIETSHFAFEALYAHASKSRMNEVEKTILFPRFIHSSSAFVNSSIGGIFRTTTFAKLMYKLLQLAVSTGDEEYVPHLLHLLHAIILDNEEIHGTNYLEKNFVNIPICNALLLISESSMTLPVIHKADYLLDIFISRDGNVMESLIDCFGNSHLDAYKKRKDETMHSKRQKSAKLAQSRKAKIMKKFAKQRETFSKENNLPSSPEVEAPFTIPAPVLRNCVYCGEAENTEKPFGIPILQRSASIFWTLSLKTPELVELAFSDFSAPLISHHTDVYSKAFPRKHRGSSDVISSCGHGFHIDCRERSRSLSTFPSPCPLCHNLYEDAVPSFIRSPLLFDLAFLFADPLTLDLKKYVLGINDVRNQTILKVVILNNHYGENRDQRKSILEMNNSILKICPQKDPRLRMEKLESLIARTVKAHEISMRIEEENENNLFFRETPLSLRNLICSLIQSRVLFLEAHKSLIASSYEKSAGDDLSSYLREKGIFEEIVSLLFSTNESWKTLIRFGLSKLIALNALTLCCKFDSFLQSADLALECPINQGSTDCAKRYCDELLGFLAIDFNSKRTIYFKNFFIALERSILPFLRQCAIMSDILLENRCAESLLLSDSELSRVSLFRQPQDYKYSSEPICMLLGIPRLVDILSGLTGHNIANFEQDVSRAYISAELRSRSTKFFETLEYPNVPRLINLPNDYNRTITDPKNTSPSDLVCLLCGDRIPSWLKSSHQSECSPLCLLFCPQDNSITTVIELAREPFELKIPGPYMTSHGEVKAANSNEKAALNYLRYSNLNKLWINQELFGFVTRTMYGESLRPMEADLQDDSLEEEEEEEAFDEFGF